MTTSTPFRDLLHAANLRHGTDGFTFPPKEGVLRIFSPLKIRRLRPGLNPQTWVVKASTQPLDHRSRIIYTYPQQISTYTENSSLKFKSQSENKFTIHILGFLVFSSNQNSSRLIVLPFHYSSTKKLPQLRHLNIMG